MTGPRVPIVILMADADPEECLLAKEALEEARLANPIRFVEDGRELMDYLQRTGKYADPADSPRPGVILLNLDMPRKDGRQALQEIRGDPDLRRIPVVVMTTSEAPEDIWSAHELGADSTVVKPLTFAGLVEVMRALGRYWFEIV